MPNRRVASLAGFEPAISTVTGWRALQAALQGRLMGRSKGDWLGAVLCVTFAGRDATCLSPF
jgi:hypothetical protein